jgi:hypothetical protein
LIVVVLGQVRTRIDHDHGRSRLSTGEVDALEYPQGAARGLRRDRMLATLAACQIDTRNCSPYSMVC